MPEDAVQQSLKDTLQEVNGMLEGHEKLSTIFVVNDPWTVDNELLTPTLKIKRDVLEKRYSNLIRQEGGPVIMCEPPGDD